MTSIAPDTLVDERYRVRRKLGSGGMADVYCAEDEQLGRQVALKLLHPRFAGDEQFVERFRREARSAAGLQHPNIVGVFDRGEWGGNYYIAMEYLDGPTVKELVRDRGPLPPDTAAAIAIQVLRALRFAHKRGVVHRDIKPHNVIVDGEGRVKVTDFGIARAGPSEMTETGTIVGTAHYLSPEQAQGQPVDERSDLYSVGVMLYETLTGRVPFDADSTVSIALQHVSEPPVPPSQLEPTVPPELDAVVLRALEKDPDRRFQDADEFIAALEAPASVVAAPPVVAEPVERRRWWLWLLLALLLLALAAGAYLLLGGKTVTVPDVVGERSSEAADRLQSRGLEVDVEPVRSDDVPRDRVVRQDPRAGEEVDEGSTVTIAVSAGPGEVEVPDVVGDRREAAERELTEAGFKVDVRRAFDDEVERGRVISTSPEPGTVAERGSDVALRVSRGPERVTVPDVTGRSEDDARATLEDAGLQVESDGEASADQDPGTVLRQDPESGAEVERGSTVTIVVAEAPPPVSVPDVLELDEAEAQAELEGAGFTVRVREEPVDGPDEDGTVLDQTPGPGEEAEPGSRVTIVVGRFEPDLDPDPGADEGGGEPIVEPGA